MYIRSSSMVRYEHLGMRITYPQHYMYTYGKFQSKLL